MPEKPVTSIKDSRLGPFRRAPEERGGFLVEGSRMIRLGLDAGWTPRAALFLDPITPEAQEIWRACALRFAPIRAARGIFYKVLGLGYETATDALGLFDLPVHDGSVLTAAAARPGRPLVLVGEQIQDPRNVGVLIRTADAFALEALALTRDSAFPWSRQALRSTTGSIFRVPIHVGGDAVSILRALREMGVQIVGSSAGAEAALEEVPLRYPCAVVVGNETTGMSSGARELCDVVARITMGGGAHSLNVTVAAGILVHAAHRRRSEP